MTPGALIKVGDDGRTICVPSLTVPQLRKHRAKLQEIIAGNFVLAEDDAMMNDFVSIAYEATVRNHPEMTEKEFEELLDLRSMGQILIALLGAGSYIVPEAEDKADAMLKAAFADVSRLHLVGRPPDA